MYLLRLADPTPLSFPTLAKICFHHAAARLATLCILIKTPSRAGDNIQLTKWLQKIAEGPPGPLIESLFSPVARLGVAIGAPGNALHPVLHCLHGIALDGGDWHFRALHP